MESKAGNLIFPLIIISSLNYHIHVYRLLTPDLFHIHLVGKSDLQLQFSDSCPWQNGQGADYKQCARSLWAVNEAGTRREK